MKRLLSVAHVLGQMLMVFGLTYLFPVLAALIYGDGTLGDFLLAMLANIGIGCFVWLGTGRYRADLKPRDGFLLVSLGWILMATTATIPLLLVIPHLSFTDAFFETMSGLTTTGATILVNLDTLPEAINLWRHALQWYGGMGIIVLAVAVLPLLGVGGMQLYRAETPGPLKDAKLTPRIAGTAKGLWAVYAGITAVCVLLLKLAGMNWLDAVCHAFSAMSLGGFSTHDASVGYFNSVAIEIILIVFMVIAAMNFATHFLAVRQQSLRPYLRDAEVQAMLALVAGSCVMAAGYLWWTGTYPSFWTALRHASFNLVSVATDCGFASVDFDKWPMFVPVWMLFLSCITCSSGSTGGGIKMFRTILMCQQASREMLRLLHPQVMAQIKIGDLIVPNNIVYAVLAFLALYFMSIVLLTFMLLASGLDPVSSISAIIACINNMGPGLNKVGPAGNYAGLSDFQTWVCAFAMLLGRLELFTLLVIFAPAFWRR